MTGFLGSYLHQLDEKGRIALPAAFRRVTGEESLVLVQNEDPALILYPNAAWAQVEEKLGELMHKSAEARERVLKVVANAVEVVPDKQGRILIPERLQDAARLEGQALVVGVFDRIELWNPGLFEELTSEPKPELDQFLRQIL
ncbi:MAG: division/cell wall cluster transcriptional repressor MraZ [Gemmatimonadota bacterium]|nr:division/cell wall cluster transcriptional repressor MraZ [Candidatus Palauibacterales bacterium]